MFHEFNIFRLLDLYLLRRWVLWLLHIYTVFLYMKWNLVKKSHWKYLHLKFNIKRLQQICQILASLSCFVFFFYCISRYTSSSRLIKTSHLGDLFSEWTLLLSPRLREARDKLETEKTRWREPGCEMRCGTAWHSYTDTTKNINTTLSTVFCANPVTEQCSPSVVTKINSHIQKYTQNSYGHTLLYMHKNVSIHIM